MVIQKIEAVGLTSEETEILKQAKELIYQIYVSTEDDEIACNSRECVDSIAWILIHSKNIDE